MSDVDKNKCRIYRSSIKISSDICRLTIAREDIMKSASSQLIIRLIAGVFVILVFLLNTLSLAEGCLTPALEDNKENLNIEKEEKREFEEAEQFCFFRTARC